MGLLEVKKSVKAPTPTETTDVDPDKYKGTLGLADDAPKKSGWPHFIAFPSAEKGEWVRCVSDTKIGSTIENQVSILFGQRWICKADKTKEKTPASWELIQNDSIFDRYIGTLGSPEKVPTTKKTEISTAIKAIVNKSTETSAVSISTPIAISGIPKEGNILAASIPNVLGLVGTISYQWQSSPDAIVWTNIDGATQRTLTLALSDVGQGIRVIATYRTTVGATRYQNFITFPAAEKNDWVRVTENATINGILVREGEEWFCNERTASDTPSHWELKSAAIPYSQLSRLDTSQYIGSVGLTKDAPANAPASHFTQFPTANEGDWVQIVSTYRVNDLLLFDNVQVNSGETWICNTDNTEAENLDNWDRLILSPKTGILEEVGFYFLSRYDFFSIPTGVKSLVEFNPANTDQIIRGYYLGSANEISVVGNYINITPWKNYASRNNIDVYIDVECDAYFESDANGDRNVSVLYWAGTLKNNVYDYAAALYLESQTNLAARAGETTAKLKVTRFKIDWISPKNPNDILIHAISVELLQTSGIALPVRRCTIILGLSKEH